MKKTVLLGKRDLKKLTKQLPGWSLNTKQTILKRSLTFPTHIEALVFVARVTVHAEVLQHHPDIKFTYKKITISLTTRDLKGLTKVDITLATRIDNLLGG